MLLLPQRPLQLACVRRRSKVQALYNSRPMLLMILRHMHSLHNKGLHSKLSRRHNRLT